MTIKNHIEGVLTLATAMHVTAFGKPNEEMQKPVITPSGRFFTPYFPANDFRGRARRKAASRIMANWKEKGLTISDELYLGLTCGASSGNPENGKSVEEIVRANQNVYMGVFGGGTRMLRSGYRVQDMDVVSQTNIDAGIVPAHLGEQTEGGFVPSEYKDGQVVPIREGWQLLHSYLVLRKDDIMNVARIDEATGIIDGGVDTIARYQTSVLSERSDGKAAKAAAKESGVAAEKVARGRVENLQTFEAVAPGTPMYFRMDMADTLSPEQAGLLILCLRDLLEEGEFGGYVRLGLGKVNVREMKFVMDGTAMPLFEDNRALKLADKAAKLVDLAEAAIEKLTVEDMNRFFTSSKGE